MNQSVKQALFPDEKNPKKTKKLAVGQVTWWLSQFFTVE